VLRQVHVAGERLFVDHVGPTMPVVDARTGDVREAQIFVGALGASHLIDTEATWTQTLFDWIGTHVRMLEYVGAVPALIVPDNLKSAVRQPCYYDPDLHQTYQDFATHYGTAILPARAYYPRDKAKVETAVQIVEREILALLRHDVFHSLAEPNHALAFRREGVNDRPFQKLAGSRRSVFEQTERATLRPLPAARYELAEWKTAKVNIDYTTGPTHRPKSHQQHLDWTPSRLVAWGASIGEATARVLPPETDPPALHLPATHEHVRGAAYYQACITNDADANVLTLCGESACSIEQPSPCCSPSSSWAWPPPWRSNVACPISRASASTNASRCYWSASRSASATPIRKRLR